MGWKDKLKDRREALGLNDQRIIPTKIINEGNRERCNAAKGYAFLKLSELSNRVFSGTTPLKQGWQNTIKAGNGVTINIFVSYNFNIVQITADGGVSGEDMKKWKCLCNCNLAVGKIISRVLTGTLGTPYANIGVPEARFYVYSVTICQTEKIYMLFDNILGNDFTPWEVGQKVILMAYKNFNFGCCYPDQVAAFGEDFVAAYDAKSCKGYRESNTATMTYPSWRAPFRILTFCALPLKFKYDMT